MSFEDLLYFAARYRQMAERETDPRLRTALLKMADEYDLRISATGAAGFPNPKWR
jgi:hypothetical protein